MSKLKRATVSASLIAFSVLLPLFGVANASSVSLWVDYSITNMPSGYFGGWWTCVELKGISMPASINLSVDGFNDGFKSLTFKMLSPDPNRFFILFYVDYDVSIGKEKAQEYATSVISEVLKAFNYCDFTFLNGEVNVYTSAVEVKRSMGWGDYTLENIYSFLSQSKSVVQPLVDSYFLGKTPNRGITEIGYSMNSTFGWSLTIACSETEKLNEKGENKMLTLTDLFTSNFLENVDEVKITLQKQLDDWHICVNAIQPDSYINNSDDYYWTFKFEEAKPVIENITVTFSVKNEEADKPWTPSLYDGIVVSCSIFALITGTLTIKKWRNKK